MSENHYKLECISETPEDLAQLFDELKKFEGRSDAGNGPLLAFFDGWDEPSVESANLYGNLLIFNVVTSSHDTFSKSQIMALHKLGADFIRVHAEYTQVGESRAYCYHSGRKIPAKSFPKPELDDRGKAYMFLQSGKDGPLSMLIKAGLGPDVMIDGRPLFIHVCEMGLGKSLAALLKIGVDFEAYKNYPKELVYGINCVKDRKDGCKLLKELISSGVDVNEVWRASLGFYGNPDMMAVLIAAGADINQRLAGWRGSLFFHSAEFFDDDPKLVTLLESNGAQAIPPEPYLPRQRLEHLIHGRRGADSIEQLVVDGVDLDVFLSGNESAALYALDKRPAMALGLISAGANIGEWLDPIFFQEKVLPKIAFRYPGFPSREEDSLVVLDIIKLLQSRGLDLNMECRSYVYFNSSYCFGYVGSLFMLLMNFCCVENNELAPLRLSLAKLFVETGVNINVPSGGEEHPLISHSSILRLELTDGYVERFRNLGCGSSLYHLEQQGSPDPVDRQFMQFLKDNGGVSIRTREEGVAP